MTLDLIMNFQIWPPKAQTVKEKVDKSDIRKSYIQGHYQENEDNLHTERKYLKLISDTIWYPKYIKNSHTSITRQTTWLKITKYLSRHFSKENIYCSWKDVNKPMKRC